MGENNFFSFYICMAKRFIGQHCYRQIKMSNLGLHVSKYIISKM